jgi:pimeloyl-ACP methyl ester carboxylesterase
MYVFDYGAPIGFRLALKHPEKIQSIITQNGNVYEEGLGKKWEARKEYWKNPTKELRKQFSSAYAFETIKNQYTFGTPLNSVAPDGYILDFAYVSLPERNEIQNDFNF